MEIGLASGLAQNLQFDQRIGDLRAQQEMDRRAKAEAIARAKMFADEQEYQHATNAYDEALLKDDAKKLFTEIGSIRNENPDWEWNPDVRAVIKDKINSLKTHPALIRSLTVDESKKQLMKDLSDAARNPGSYDQEAYALEQQKLQNYMQFGHPDGEEGLKREGAPQPYVYARPKDLVNLASELPKLGNAVKDYDVVDTGNGGYYTKPKEGQLEQLKNAAYSQYGREIELASKKLGLDTPEKVDQWLTQSISSGFDKSHSLGDPLAIRRLQIAESQLDLQRRKFAAESQPTSLLTPWEDLMNPNKESVALPRDVFNKVWPENPKIVFTGVGGQKADLTGYDFKFDGSVYKPQSGKYKGMPFAVGHVEMPIEAAKEKGIVKDTNWFQQADDIDEWQVAKGFDPKRVQIDKVFSKDGSKSQVIARILTEVPLDPMDVTAKSLYQVATAPSKFYTPQARPIPQMPTGSKQDFLNSGWTDEQIQEGLSKGLIQVR